MFLTKDKKSPFFQIVYFVDGKRTKISTKKSKRSEAEKILNSFKFSFNPQKPVKTNSINLSEFRDEYVSYMEASKSKHYVRSVKLSFKHLQMFTGDISIRELTTKTLDQFITSVYSRSDSGASLYYRTLKAAFSKAVVWEYLQDNPLKKIKSPKSFKIFSCIYYMMK